MIFQSNKLTDVKRGVVRMLSGLYSHPEAENIANILIRHFFGLSRVMQQIEIEKRLSESELLLVQKAVKRLMKCEPIQYVVGSANFNGLELEVSSGVLIPRPETEELVTIILKDIQDDNIDILDVGTGSGCIALALKNSLAKSKVTAVDISEEALAQARRNAKNLHLKIDFRRCNILDTEVCQTTVEKEFHIMVSNPPYVLQKEKEQMADNVLKYEPPLALFVEDDDPLLFYRKILHLAQKLLMPNGKLYLEINENYAEETAALFNDTTFVILETRTDFLGKRRFLIIRKL